MELHELLNQYEQGPQLLANCIRQVPESAWDLHPISGRWSIRQVVCHIADFEPIGADRMKRVLVEDNPTLFGADESAFASLLHYEHRDVANELQLIAATRRQMTAILRRTELEDFQRTGVHTEAGPLTLESLLERMARHIPHHLSFIEQKVAAIRTAR
jgi:uncharacterized damage-inducible protein DinB